ncbi:ATP-grasp domain-containing protein [Legionella gresilensis]|uniref:ATP-grasp domain-containing protein n=1 Tax=Legionella gresilensis TaxID=91823 RepID=UPI0010418D7A|nr:ATP-grasp domain-containing protein [Legionella gresilensis]
MIIQPNSILVIIDGYSTGSYLIDKLTSLQISCIHVITPSTINSAASDHFNCPTNNPNYLEEILWDGDFNKLLNYFKKWHILNIVCCIDGDGIELREKLAFALNLPHNEINHLNARLDKFYMAECLYQTKLPCLRQILFSSLDEAITGLDKVGGFPVVIKPRNSSDSNGFHVCHNLLQLKNACKDLLGKKNLLGFVNKALLLQEFLVGKEYALNAVSYKGKHYFTDMWFYDNDFTEEGFRICHSCTLEKKINPSLMNYVSSCLDALGIYFGATHTELMLTAKGPIMIESAARLMGGLPNNILEEALTLTQLDALVVALLYPDQLHTTLYRTKAHSKIVNIIFSKPTGIIRDICLWNWVVELPSYRHHNIFVKKGEEVRKTSAGAACLARIYLVNCDPEQLKKDTEFIWAQQNNFFVTS